MKTKEVTNGLKAIARKMNLRTFVPPAGKKPGYYKDYEPISDNDLKNIDDMYGLLKDGISNLEKSIVEFKSQLEELAVTNFDRQSFLSGEFQQVAKKILLEQLSLAISATPELQISELEDPLIAAFSKDEMISVTMEPTKVYIPGYSTQSYDRLVVKINAEEVAGSIDELGTAITATRQKLNYGDKFKGTQATNAWYNGLYRYAREGRALIKKRKGWQYPQRDEKGEDQKLAIYMNIINTRLSLLNSKPAYWYLLEHGNYKVKLSSDKGGLGRPVWGATNFVSTSERLIEEKAKQMLQSKMEENTQSRVDKTKELKRYLESAQKRLSTYKKLLDDLKELLSTGKGKTIQPSATERKIALQRVSSVVDRIKKQRLSHMRALQLERKGLDSAMEAKLQQFVALVLKGEEFTPGYRLYIGKVNNVQLRIRTKRLIQEIRESIKEDEGSDGYIQALTDIFDNLSNFLKREIVEADREAKTRRSIKR